MLKIIPRLLTLLAFLGYPASVAHARLGVIRDNEEGEGNRGLRECDTRPAIVDSHLCERGVECVTTVNGVGRCSIITAFFGNDRRQNVRQFPTHTFFKNKGGTGYNAWISSQEPIHGDIRFNAAKENNTHKRLVLTSSPFNTNESPEGGITVGLFPRQNNDRFPNGRGWTYPGGLEFPYNGNEDDFILRVLPNTIQLLRRVSLNCISAGDDFCGDELIATFDRPAGELYAQLWFYEQGASMNARIASL